MSPPERDVAELPSRPYLKPWHRQARPGDAFVFEYAQVARVVEGRAAALLLPRLLPLLDGSAAVDEIVARLGPPVEPAILAALRALADHGLLTEGPPLGSDARAETAAFLAASGSVAPAAVEASLGTLAIATVGTGAVARELRRTLRRAGVRPTSRLDWGQAEVPRFDLVIAAPAPRELPELERWNDVALERGVAWLQVLPPNGRFAAVGPLFVPTETCCHRCFLLRRSANVEFSDELPALEAVPAPYPCPAPLASVLAGLAAALALDWLVGVDRSLAGGFYALERAQPLALGFHRVHRVPRCPACSGLEGLAPPSPWFKEGVGAHA